MLTRQFVCSLNFEMGLGIKGQQGENTSGNIAQGLLFFFIYLFKKRKKHFLWVKRTPKCNIILLLLLIKYLRYAEHDLVLVFRPAAIVGDILSFQVFSDEETCVISGFSFGFWFL